MPPAPASARAPGLPVRITGLVRRFAGEAGQPVEVLAGIDLTVPESQFVALLGPSGCGKSTLLRLVAGLDAPDGGAVMIGERSESRGTHRSDGGEPQLIDERSKSRETQRSDGGERECTGSIDERRES